jgi:hypothetical protein
MDLQVKACSNHITLHPTGQVVEAEAARMYGEGAGYDTLLVDPGYEVGRQWVGGPPACASVACKGDSRGRGHCRWALRSGAPLSRALGGCAWHTGVCRGGVGS